MTTVKASRGRPRKFDQEDALEAALQLFWQTGFRGTTTRDLENALKMSQPSIYNAFGSKQDLLLLAMDRYEARVQDELFDVLDHHVDGYQAIAAFFDELDAWMACNEYRGCLMVTLMNGDATAEVVTERVQNFRTKILDGFAKAIGRSETNETLVASRANALQAAVLGVHTSAATAHSQTEIQDMIGGIRDLVSAWDQAAKLN